MQRYIEKMGSNFLVAALIPSLAFVTMAMVIFEPIMPPGLADRLVSAFNPLGEKGVLLLALTVVLGFTLSSLNAFIYRLFEGYFLLARLHLTRRRQRRKARRLEYQLSTVGWEIRQLEEENPDDPRLQGLEDLRYYIAAELDQRFPREEAAVLPTGFGNILRAAERYAATRYGIDAVRIWPRLVHVIPEEYYEKVEQSNNRLAFLINCSVLSLLFAGLSGWAAWYQHLIRQYALLGEKRLLYFIPIDSPPEVYLQRIFIYLAICVLMALTSWIFYKASFPMAMQYGNMIRSSFDLFRFDLLRQLNLRLPGDSETEYDLWSKLSEFIATGGHRGPLRFEYQIVADKGGKESAR